MFCAVLKVTMKGDGGSSKSVAVRLYGPNTDYVINRERELHVSLILWILSIGFLLARI